MNHPSLQGSHPPPVSKQNFPIVGVGASAGGIDAFKLFLKAIPVDSGMAFVLVQHLDPLHESILPDILRKVTALPVLEITDDIHLAPNRIYVIPENKILTSTDGILKLAPRIQKKRSLPIDIFFSSLALVHQSLSAGIVLSGNGADGTLGLAEIKAQGGVTMVQDQASASVGQMPQNAIDAGVVDFVLPPGQMAAKLIAHFQSVKAEEKSFKEILQLLKKRSGVDFAAYKQTTIRRRLARRMAISKSASMNAYVELLRNDTTEQDRLFKDVLIPVTTFFRDPRTFEALCTNVLPALAKKGNEDQPIRAWIAACSTGEEAYSIAICLHECFAATMPNKKLQVFASDISDSAISKARLGVYPAADLQTVSPERLKKYFIATHDGYMVKKEIRDICVFAVHNFLKDPPFAKMDLVSCRNVLIYMDVSLQKKALHVFHYALKEKGFLVLGKSETTGPAAELFSAFSKVDKIYVRKASEGRYAYFPVQERAEKAAPGVYLSSTAKKVQQEAGPVDFRKSTDVLLLSMYTPPAVVINEQMDIVHIHGSIAFFLEPSAGKPSFNLMKMAREGLGFELRNLLFKAKSSQDKVVKDHIPIQHDGKNVLVRVEVSPISNAAEPYYLVAFFKEEAAVASALPVARKLSNNMDQLRINQLQQEIVQLREDMRSIADEQEAANEELQSGNEELQSTSEELQSLNEELETSKEELQSTNEELIIVNHELLDKQQDIHAARMYAEAIIESVRDPLLVLDKTYAIKSANDAFYKRFSINAAQANGKSILEIINRSFDNKGCRLLLKKVMVERSEATTHEVKLELSNAGASFWRLNARQIINQKSDEPLVLLIMEDITVQREHQQRQEEFAAKLEAEVKERTASLNQTNLLLDDFVHTASHEFKEPLRKIITFSKMLQTGYAEKNGQQIKTYLNKIDDAAQRLNDLVEHLLKFASVTMQDELFEPTDLNQVFTNIAGDFELLIAEKQAVLTCDPLPTLYVVPFQMCQLFYDLLSNALKFVKKGRTPAIHVACKKMTPAMIKRNKKLNNKFEYYELVFQDNGIGFNQKYAGQIFTMFQKLNTNSSYSGTGIGLALCQKIVHDYQGDIFAFGEEDKGAAIHVILPAGPAWEASK